MKIARSRARDLKSVLAWLESEWDPVEGEGFWGNRSAIAAGHKSRNLFVLREDDEPLAFLLAHDEYMAIMEVQPEKRGQGYGAALVNYYIERAHREHFPALELECVPSSSAEFWRAMGFTISTSKGLRAYYVIPETFHLAKNLPSADVTVEVYEQGDSVVAERRMISSFRPPAVRIPGVGVRFGERVALLQDQVTPTTFINITVDGEIVYSDRAAQRNPELGIVHHYLVVYLDYFRFLKRPHD